MQSEQNSQQFLVKQSSLLSAVNNNSTISLDRSSTDLHDIKSQKSSLSRQSMQQKVGMPKGSKQRKKSTNIFTGSQKNSTSNSSIRVAKKASHKSQIESQTSSLNIRMQKQISDRLVMAENVQKNTVIIQRKSCGSIPTAGSGESEKSQKSSSFKKGQKRGARLIKENQSSSHNAIKVDPQNTNRQSKSNKATLPNGIISGTTSNSQMHHPNQQPVFEFDITKDEPKWLKSQHLNSQDSLKNELLSSNGDGCDSAPDSSNLKNDSQSPASDPKVIPPQQLTHPNQLSAFDEHDSSNIIKVFPIGIQYEPLTQKDQNSKGSNTSAHQQVNRQQNTDSDSIELDLQEQCSNNMQSYQRDQSARPSQLFTVICEKGFHERQMSSVLLKNSNSGSSIPSGSCGEPSNSPHFEPEQISHEDSKQTAIVGGCISGEAYSESERDQEQVSDLQIEDTRQMTQQESYEVEKVEQETPLEAYQTLRQVKTEKDIILIEEGLKSVQNVPLNCDQNQNHIQTKSSHEPQNELIKNMTNSSCSPSTQDQEMPSISANMQLQTQNSATLVVNQQEFYTTPQNQSQQFAKKAISTMQEHQPCEQIPIPIEECYSQEESSSFHTASDLNLLRQQRLHTINEGGSSILDSNEKSYMMMGAGLSQRDKVTNGLGSSQQVGQGLIQQSLSQNLVPYMVNNDSQNQSDSSFNLHDIIMKHQAIAKDEETLNSAFQRLVHQGNSSKNPKVQTQMERKKSNQTQKSSVSDEIISPGIAFQGRLPLNEAEFHLTGDLLASQEGDSCLLKTVGGSEEFENVALFQQKSRGYGHMRQNSNSLNLNGQRSILSSISQNSNNLVHTANHKSEVNQIPTLYGQTGEDQRTNLGKNVATPFQISEQSQDKNDEIVLSETQKQQMFIQQQMQLNLYKEESSSGQHLHLASHSNSLKLASQKTYSNSNETSNKQLNSGVLMNNEKKESIRYALQNIIDEDQSSVGQGLEGQANMIYSSEILQQNDFSSSILKEKISGQIDPQFENQLFYPTKIVKPQDEENKNRNDSSQNYSSELILVDKNYTQSDNSTSLSLNKNQLNFDIQQIQNENNQLSQVQYAPGLANFLISNQPQNQSQNRKLMQNQQQSSLGTSDELMQSSSIQMLNVGIAENQSSLTPEYRSELMEAPLRIPKQQLLGVQFAQGKEHLVPSSQVEEHLFQKSQIMAQHYRTQERDQNKQGKESGQDIFQSLPKYTHTQPDFYTGQVDDHMRTQYHEIYQVSEKLSDDDDQNCEGNTIVLDEKICMQKTVYSDANQGANPGKRVSKAQSRKLKKRKSKLRKHQAKQSENEQNQDKWNSIQQQSSTGMQSSLLTVKSHAFQMKPKAAQMTKLEGDLGVKKPLFTEDELNLSLSLEEFKDGGQIQFMNPNTKEVFLKASVQETHQQLRRFSQFVQNQDQTSQQPLDSENYTSKHTDLDCEEQITQQQQSLSTDLIVGQSQDVVKSILRKMLEFQVHKKSLELNGPQKKIGEINNENQKTTLVDVTWTHEEMLALTEMFKSAVTEDLTRREVQKSLNLSQPIESLTPQNLLKEKTNQLNGFTELACQTIPMIELVQKQNQSTNQKLNAVNKGCSSNSFHNQQSQPAVAYHAVSDYQQSLLTPHNTANFSQYTEQRMADLQRQNEVLALQVALLRDEMERQKGQNQSSVNTQNQLGQNQQKRQILDQTENSHYIKQVSLRSRPKTQTRLSIGVDLPASRAELTETSDNQTQSQPTTTAQDELIKGHQRLSEELRIPNYSSQATQKQVNLTPKIVAGSSDKVTMERGVQPVETADKSSNLTRSLFQAQSNELSLKQSTQEKVIGGFNAYMNECQNIANVNANNSISKNQANKKSSLITGQDPSTSSLVHNKSLFDNHTSVVSQQHSQSFVQESMNKYKEIKVENFDSSLANQAVTQVNKKQSLSIVLDLKSHKVNKFSSNSARISPVVKQATKIDNFVSNFDAFLPKSDNIRQKSSESTSSKIFEKRKFQNTQKPMQKVKTNSRQVPQKLERQAVSRKNFDKDMQDLNQNLKKEPVFNLLKRQKQKQTNQIQKQVKTEEKNLRDTEKQAIDLESDKYEKTNGKSLVSANGEISIVENRKKLKDLRMTLPKPLQLNTKRVDSLKLNKIGGSSPKSPGSSLNKGFSNSSRDFYKPSIVEILQKSIHQKKSRPGTVRKSSFVVSKDGKSIHRKLSPTPSKNYSKSPRIKLNQGVQSFQIS